MKDITEAIRYIEAGSGRKFIKKRRVGGAKPGIRYVFMTQEEAAGRSGIMEYSLTELRQAKKYLWHGPIKEK